MNRLQLATMLSWSDNMSVPRCYIQKIVLCLQCAGYDLGCRFSLLKSGVYSSDVMDACDDLVASGFAVDEWEGSLSVIRPTDLALRLLKEYNFQREQDGGKAEGAEFEVLGRRLLQTSYDDLKHAASVMLFKTGKHTWEEAMREALVYHRLEHEAAKAAESLAKSIAYKMVEDINPPDAENKKENSMESKCAECGSTGEVAVEIQDGKSVWRFCSDECSRRWRDDRSGSVPRLSELKNVASPAPMSGWISTKDKLHPDKPGLSHYEQVPCLIVRNGDVLLRQWNCEHEVWDAEDGDDFYCEAKDVAYWMPVPPVPK